VIPGGRATLAARTTTMPHRRSQNHYEVTSSWLAGSFGRGSGQSRDAVVTSVALDLIGVFVSARLTGTM
jgi:hypothetical protein